MSVRRRFGTNVFRNGFKNKGSIALTLERELVGASQHDLCEALIPFNDPFGPGQAAAGQHHGNQTPFGAHAVDDVLRHDIFFALSIEYAERQRHRPTDTHGVYELLAGKAE